MFIIWIIIVIAGLVFIYRNRTEAEENLGWKVVGYFILGGFTFTINGLVLPIGFLLYLLLFHPGTNKVTKRHAALYGLVLMILGKLLA